MTQERFEQEMEVEFRASMEVAEPIKEETPVMMNSERKLYEEVVPF